MRRRQASGSPREGFVLVYIADAHTLLVYLLYTCGICKKEEKEDTHTCTAAEVPRWTNMAQGCTGIGSYAVSSVALRPEIQPKKPLLTAEGFVLALARRAGIFRRTQRTSTAGMISVSE